MEDELGPIRKGELSKLKVILQYGSHSEKMDAFMELPKYGKDAASLVPMIIEALKSGEEWVSFSTLVKLLDETGDYAIVEALRSTGKLGSLGSWEKVTCLRHGALELEKELLRILWESRNNLDPIRREIVEALKEYGGPASFEVMKKIKAELSDLHDLPGAEPEGGREVLKALERQAQIAFREAIERALARLAERGKLNQ